MPVDAGRIQTMAEQLIRENPKRRILDFTLEGQKYWIKRKLGNGRNQLVKYSVEKDFYYEIARMTIAGRFHPELVPHMVCLTPDYMVTLDGGPTLKNVLAASETGLKGVEESEFILKTIAGLGIQSEVELDLTLARGLNYYTGAIFEVKALDVQIGRISGGGRYDNLTGVFGMEGMSGVGSSFGADRIYDVLNQLDLYPKEAVNGTQLLFVNFGEAEAAYVLPVLAQVRAAGIRAENYPEAAKMKKQMSYANAKMVPFVAIVGENEMKEGKVMLKNMTSGEQSLVTPDELVAAING